MGGITPQQAVNAAVDDGDLPDEFLIEDETGQVRLEDDENALASNDKPDGEEIAVAKGYGFRY